MNTLGKSIVRKLGYSFGANIISLFVSVLTVSMLPKYMDIADYGMYQLFLFYFSYVGFLHFGVLGGAIIRYAGCTYFDLDYAVLKSQCGMLLIILIVLSCLLYILNSIFSIFTNEFILFFFCISMFSQHVIWYSISMLQMSNRIEDASRLLLGERISWGILSMGAVLLGYTHAFNIIMIYSVTRVLVMLYSLFFVPEIVKAPFLLDHHVWEEFKANFLIGFPITLSDICSLLIIGIIRFAISDVWNITVFAKTSLILSITFFFLTFITSASTVLLPALRLIQDSISDTLYGHLNQFISLFFLGALLLYYPMNLVILYWLPRYTDSIMYMGIIFPILFFESKFNLLVVTYLKKLLKTKLVFYINIFSAVSSFFGCLICCYYFRNLTMSMSLITIILGIRCSMGEFVLGHCMCIEKMVLKEYMMALLMICIFEFGICLLTSRTSFWLYLLSVLAYIFISSKKIKKSWQYIRTVMSE